MKVCRIACTAFAVLAAGGLAQAAAAAQASIKIEGRAISVNYNAPSVNGRKIFGDVVPYGKVWPIGENAAATFHTDADLVYKGGILPKGDYSLYALVTADGWQLIFNKQTGAKTADYDAKMDAARAPMTVSKAKAPVETCKITLSTLAEFGAKLELSWESTVASVPLFLDIVPGDPEW